MPDLARSLGAHGAALIGAGQPGPAAGSFAEGLRAALRLFATRPDAVAHLIGPLVFDYRQACTAANIEPDEDLASIVDHILAVGKTDLTNWTEAELAPLRASVSAQPAAQPKK